MAGRFRSIFLCMTAVLLALSLIFSLSLLDAHAASIVVTTLEDELNSDSDCSLREAITAANTNLTTDACVAGEASGLDTITFSVSGIIALSSQLPNIENGGPLIIDGGDALTIGGQDQVRAFYVNSGANMTLQNLTVADGSAQDPSDGYGGGLYNYGGIVTIDHSIFTGNSAYSGGGGLYNSSQGTVTINASTFTDNGASSPGDDLISQGGGVNNQGGSLYQGSMTILDSNFTNNRAEDCGGLKNWGNMRVERSLISGNNAEGGGGICNGSWSLTVLNSDVLGNTGRGLVNDNGDVDIARSEFSGNSGGGISNSGGTMDIINSVLSGNH